MMNTVGTDKHTQYYRMNPADVLKALKSHPLGLTNSAAARRQTELGANVLPGNHVSTSLLLLQSAGHPFVAATAFAALLASTAGQTGAALLLAGLTALHISLRFGHLHAYVSTPMDITLPRRVKVTRNDQTRELEAAKLVVGDIVHVEAGETVAADLRILEEHELVANDSLLFGGNLHTRKFSHAVSQPVPLIARNNQLWAGSTIVQGTARGVVIAIGAQTELGRIMALRHAAQLHVLARQDRSSSRYIYSSLVLLGAAAILLLGWISGASSTNMLFSVLLFVVSAVPHGLGLSRWLLSLQAVRSLSKQRAAAFQDSALTTLGRADMAIIDTAEAAKNAVAATAVTIGRATYTAENTGYEPTGKIADEHGKSLTRKQTTSLKLFFEACALVNNAAVLRPDTHHKAWHARGNLYEVAALVLARKAGFNTEQLQAGHDVVHSFPYDAGRQLASSIRRYGNDTVVFVRGNPAAVLERSRKLWDHGHVRPLSAGDKAFFTRQTPAVKGKAYMAFAYRILPDKVDASTLDMDTAEQGLTFLGVVSMEHTNATDSLVAAAQAAGLRTVTISTDAHAGSISSAALRELTDTQLIDQLQGNGAFSRLAAEDILRLVITAQSAGNTVIMIGNSLADLPARIQADAGFTIAASRRPGIGGIQDAAELTAAAQTGRSLLAKLTRARRLAVICSTAMATLALVSAAGLFYYQIPVIASLGAVLALQLLVFPLAAYALPAAKIHQVTVRELAGAGGVLGLLTYGCFVSSFSLQGISPNFINPASRFAAEAATTAAVTLGLVLLIETMLTHYQAKTAPNARALVWLGASAFIVVNLAYNPWLQPLLSTTGPVPADWLISCAAALLYAGFRLFQHHTRHHTREAVLRLHHETYGKL